MLERAIADTSVLIALEKIGLLDVLCKIYSEIILPEAVLNEFGTPIINCCVTKRIESPLVKLFMGDLNLGKGESEVIALSIESGVKQQFSVKKRRDCFRIRPFAMTDYENLSCHCERSEAISRVFNFTENCWV